MTVKSDFLIEGELVRRRAGRLAMQTLRAPLYFLSPSKGFLPPKFLNPGMLRMLVGISPITQLYGLHITGQGSNVGIMGSNSPHYSLLSNSKFKVAKLLRLLSPQGCALKLGVKTNPFSHKLLSSKFPATEAGNVTKALPRDSSLSCSC